MAKAKRSGSPRPTRSRSRQPSGGASPPKATTKAKAKAKATRAAKAASARKLAASREAHAAQLKTELAALAAERKEIRARAATLESKFYAGYERCRVHHSLIGEAKLRAIDVAAELARKGRQSHGGTPWLTVGRIVPGKPGLAYSDLFWAMQAIRDDPKILAAFGGQRLSRIQLVYLDPLVGKPRDWTLSEIGPWDVVIRRAVRKLDPSAPAHESVTVRYDTDADRPSLVVEIRIWLSLITFKELRA